MKGNNIQNDKEPSFSGKNDGKHPEAEGIGGIKMKTISRITLDPDVMGGKPCIRGMRVTVGTILGLLSAGHSHERILKAYPYLEPDDIKEALAYAMFRVEEIEAPLKRETA